MSIRKFIGFGFIALASITLVACESTPPQPTTQAVEQQQSAANQQALIRSTPIPRVEHSLERANLVKRAQRVNSLNLNSCITLFSNTGAVVAFFPVDGKVSSLNSYLQSGEQVIKDPHAYTGQYYTGSIVIEAPDIDGAYGANANGIFFFTADTDAYVEWKGDYFWSDQCLKPVSASLLIQAEEADLPVGVDPLPAPAADEISLD